MRGVALRTQAAVGWPNFPSSSAVGAAHELFADDNRRRFEDWTHARRVRLGIGGGVNAPSLGQAELWASLDNVTYGPAGTYDDGGAGPAVFASKINGNQVWFGPWCTIAPQYRAPVFLKYVGRNGTDNTTPTLTIIDHEAVWFDPRFAANSTAGVSVLSQDGLCIGGSQVAGGGDADEFQTDAQEVLDAKAAINAALALGHAGGGCTVWTTTGVGAMNSPLASVGSEFGIWLGILEALRAAGKLPGTRIVGRFNAGTPTPDWFNTHWATAVADCAAVGVNPRWVAYKVGGQDSTNAAAVANLQEFLRRLAWLVENTYPGALFIVQGVSAEDAVTFTHLAQARVAGSRFMLDNPRGRKVWVPHDVTPGNLQPTDNTHKTDLGTLLDGRDAYGPVIEAISL